MRLLIADDQPDVLEALRLLLAPQGFTITPDDRGTIRDDGVSAARRRAGTLAYANARTMPRSS